MKKILEKLSGLSVKGVGGVPPDSAKENSVKKVFFRSEESIFCLFHTFLSLFGPF